MARHASGVFGGAGRMAAATIVAALVAASPAAPSTSIDPDVSAVCARAEDELAMPGVGPPFFKGGLSLEAWSRDTELIRSTECHCAMAESLLRRTATSKFQIPDPSQEPARRLAALNLELPECNPEPLLVLSIGPGACLSPELTSTVLDNVQSSLDKIRTGSVRSLLKDAVVRRWCPGGGGGGGGARGGGPQFDRFIVYRKPYGNPRSLAMPAEAEPTSDSNVSVFVSAKALEELRWALPEVFEDLAAGTLLHLKTRDARSIKLDWGGNARTGDGSVSLDIGADLQVLELETTLFEEHLALSDRLYVETDAQRVKRQNEATAKQGHGELPALAAPALQCDTSLDLDRKLDALRVAAAIFLTPTFGPGVAGGIDWLASDRIDEALNEKKVAGPLCSLALALTRRNITALGIVSLALDRAVADPSGIRLHGSLSLTAAEPAMWISRALRPTLPPLAPNTPPRFPRGIWLAANTRELRNPHVDWQVLEGESVPDGATAEACGARIPEWLAPQELWKCVVPTAEGTVSLRAVATGDPAGASPRTVDASYFLTPAEQRFCFGTSCVTQSRD